jgi:pre-60S factor REI1
MVNARHCKLRYEAGVDLEEFDVFYDFSKDNEEFLRTGIGNHKTKRRAKKRVDGAGGNGDDQDEDEDENMQVVDEENDEDGDDEWEDVDSDEEMQDDDDDDDGLYAAYEDEVAKHGFDITPLGELVFPDGRIIGHRGLSRYYKQRFAPEDSRTSVAAARRANGERLLNGRVYDTYAMAQQEAEEGGDGEGGDKKKMTALQLARAGLTMGAAAGRSGKGILVPTGGAGSNPSSFTALSLYRYRAVMKKARREEFQGRRLQQRTTLAMNKMDKKANRLMNNVSVAHAKR